MTKIRRSSLSALLLGAASLLALSAAPAQAFCGFYVASAGKLVNKESAVILARSGTRTAITMASDYTGPASEFALVVPVPEVPAESEIAVVEPRMMEEVAAWSQPRLVEYFDENPCAPPVMEATDMLAMSMARQDAPVFDLAGAAAYGVTVEAEYSVGEYDIQILSAEQSGGLVQYLQANGYQIPDGAEPVINSYLRQDMKFFVAKVNLQNYAGGTTRLRPIQVRYDSPKFMLPIRLGTVNAEGPQDMIVHIISGKGRVQPSNYRTIEMPADMDLPLFVKADFPALYGRMVERTLEKNPGAVLVEYAWNAGGCDPCAAPPVAVATLAALGTEWAETDKNALMADTHITRLRVRYDRESFPEDLMLQETANAAPYQARYVLRHPFKGTMNCEAGRAYEAALPRRFEREAQTLASLTGQPIEAIRASMAASGQKIP